MDNALRNTLRVAVTACRRILEDDLQRQLEGVFGIHASGKVEPEAALNLDRSARARREAMVSALRHLEAAGLGGREGVEQFVRESAFTVLNRLTALKLMEQPERRLIQPSVGLGDRSAGFQQFARLAPEVMRAEPDGGYRLYLELLSDDLAYLLGVLFDRSLPHSSLFPTPPVLQQVLDLINQETLAPAWREDETIGWVFQYFTPKEMRDEARKKSAAPRTAYELAFRNQFFTPRYVVEFLVDNSLGRLWWEMQRGETRLTELCRFLVRPPDQPIPERAKRDPRTLRAIDVACGSGHFLLYGFDLFQVIYEEAYADPDLGPALQRDYPTLGEYRRAMPFLILQNNLYGIDIDRRAVQIAALALWLRAQRVYQEMGVKMPERPRLQWINVVAAEAMPGEADLLDEFLGTLEHPVIRSLVRKIWQAMRGAGEIGSLLKIEQVLAGEIAAARKAWASLEPLVQQSFLDMSPAADASQPASLDFVDNEAFWAGIHDQVMTALGKFSGPANRKGHAIVHHLFAQDAVHGVKFLDLLREPFDVAWMNPPFGAASLGAKDYIEAHYPRTKNDLYAAFVERGLEILRVGGLLGAITSRTGFFLTSFRQWREEILLKEADLIVMADLGYGVLDTAMVETAAYVISKR